MYIDAREYLEEIRTTRIAINNISRELKSLDYMIEAQGISFNPDVVQSSPRQDGLERKAIAHIEKCAEYRANMTEKMEWLHKQLNEAVMYINKIDSDDQREVLMLRYIEHKNWSEILEERNCDDIRSQYKLHERALKSFQMILNNTI
jgi:hypothetical protein